MPAGRTVTATWGWVMGIVGLVPILTGLTGRCPAYTLMGINTCKK